MRHWQIFRRFLRRGLRLCLCTSILFSFTEYTIKKYLVDAPLFAYKIYIFDYKSNMKFFRYGFTPSLWDIHKDLKKNILRPTPFFLFLVPFLYLYCVTKHRTRCVDLYHHGGRGYQSDATPVGTWMKHSQETTPETAFHGQQQRRLPK